MRTLRRLLAGRRRRALLCAIDATLAAASLSAATAILGIQPALAPVAPPTLAMLAALAAARIASSVALRLDRWSFRFSGLTDGARLAVSLPLGSVGFLVVATAAQIALPSLPILVLELLLSAAGQVALRFGPRLLWNWQAERETRHQQDSQRVLILGAGATGEMLLRDLGRSPRHRYEVVGFLDDDPQRHDTIVGGCPILGGIDRLPDLASRLRIGELLVAIPRLPAARLREILELTTGLGIRIRHLPLSFLDHTGSAASVALRHVSPADLLPRRAVRFDSHRGGANRYDDPIHGRRVLVTGGAGSIGSEIVRQLVRRGAARVVAMDLAESSLYFLERELGPHAAAGQLAIEIGSVTNRRRLAKLIARHRPTDVFHAAALKHVPLLESCPCEAIAVNVFGTCNVMAASRSAGVERCVVISSDKAAAPVSILGATKRLAELAATVETDSTLPRLSVVRFGNVLGSAGSVVPLFRGQIAAGGPLTVTHPEVTRYFMTVDEAANLVLQAAFRDAGPLCLLDMGEPFRILDLAHLMITMAGLRPGVDIPIEIIGLRPGEKLREDLLGPGETILDARDGIQRAHPAPAPPDLKHQLERLRGLVEQGDDGAARELLFRLVAPWPATTRSPPEGLAAAGENQEVELGCA